MDTESATRRLTEAFQRAGIQGRITGDQARAVAAEAGLPLRRVECAALAAGIVPERYAKNIGSVGLDGQRALLESCVAVVGLGGLGGHVVESLARVGVGRLVGVDGDAFVESNLNRQVLSRTDNLDEPKARAAAARVVQINPAVEFVPHAARFEALGERFPGDCGLVMDCLDSIPARLGLVERCARAGVTLVHGAIAGWSGQVAICPPGGDLLAKLYAPGARGAEEQSGNLPFTAALAANLMAAWAVALLLGQEPQQKIVFFDLKDGDWETAEM